MMWNTCRCDGAHHVTPRAKTAPDLPTWLPCGQFLSGDWGDGDRLLIIQLDELAVCRHASPNVEDVLGFSPDALIGQPFDTLDFSDVEDSTPREGAIRVTSCRRFVQQLIHQGEVPDSEVALLTAWGDQQHFHCRGRPCRCTDFNGSVTTSYFLLLKVEDSSTSPTALPSTGLPFQRDVSMLSRYKWLRDVVSQSSHKLNNLFTLLYCLLDLALTDSSRDWSLESERGRFLQELRALVDEAAQEVRALNSAPSDFARHNRSTRKAQVSTMKS